ncbi:MAG: DUF615 domain-containing protein [Deltaproteobacteria bacterium]|nr:DUF615 domain-containing protein [Deltaproteobacteria bacterium]
MEPSEKSRTQKKNEARALQKMGEQLLGLTPEQLEQIDLPKELMEALKEARGMTSHGARRRQVKYIGALVRETDPLPIREALENIRRGDHEKAAVFKQVERWRDALKAGDTALIEEILASCPGAQRQRLTQLTRSAQAEFGSQSGAKASRALFRYLKDVYEP